MQVGDVRRRVLRAIAESRERAKGRRERKAGAERAYQTFLQEVATPLFHQVAAALKAEQLAFTVFTPGGGLRLTADRRRDDFVELELDTSEEQPHVVGHVRYTRGSRTIDSTIGLGDGTPPEKLTEEDVLEFVLRAIEPWIE
jgi:hypothetical protein